MDVFQDVSDEMKTPFPLFEQFEIDIMRINNNYALECAYNGKTPWEFDDIFTEAPENESDKNKTGGFMAWVQKIAQRVARLFSDFAEMIKNMFSAKDHIDLDSFAKTEQGQAQIQYDLRLVQDSVDAEIRKGRKLIQLISNTTKVDDEQVERYVDGCATAIKRFAVPTVITASSIAIFKGWEKKNNARQSEMNGAANDMRNAAGDKQKEAAVTKIYNSMTKIVNEGLKAYGQLARQASK